MLDSIYHMTLNYLGITRLRSVVGNVSDCRNLSDCSKFNPSPVTYFRGD